MELIKLNLISKNNVRNGFYLYAPIVKVNGKYFFCESIKTTQPVKDFTAEQLTIKRQIPEQFLKANGLNTETRKPNLIQLTK
jgi:hypothetical protein